MRVVDRSFDQTLVLEEHASMLLAGGILGQGYQCGQLWGAALAAGARAYQRFGPGPQAETAAVIAAQRLVNIFRDRYHEINCLELTGADIKVPKQALKYLAKGGPIRCFSMTAGYASAAFREINSALSEPPVGAIQHPVSCAAVLAQKMGLNERQTVMAASLAGGIGLSGGACGVLGAAIWILSLKGGKEGMQFSYDDPKASATIERFLESSDYEFECSQITGRKFESVQDHASFLRDGGCSKIIETLSV